MSACRTFAPRLALWAGGDLDPREVARLEKHLATCPACCEQLERLQQALKTLEQADPEPTYLEAPRSLWPRVARGLQAAAQTPPIPIYRRRAVQAGGLACLLALLSWSVWSRLSTTPEEAVPATQTTSEAAVETSWPTGSGSHSLLHDEVPYSTYPGEMSPVYGESAR